MLDELGARGQIDWAAAIVDATAVRAKRGGTPTGPDPVDRDRKGSTLHVLSDAAGLPPVVAVSAVGLHDSKAFKPLLMALPAIRSRRGPRRRRPVKARVGKAYHSAGHLAWPRGRGIIPRIARPGIESGERLGRHCWVIERTLAWLLGYRRLTIRYERHGHLFTAFLALAATITCYKKPAQLTT
ncbi:hypothetical protein Acsp03_56310 [Actinomadura sp. NBRC 104412]|uniref:transposase n=1 Tax=Actinomadura sp. NBRC 104412 TaxID=3032203 RepID=UPI0024A0F03B|nr:transposase [Actinomadura sp. NBRC 104412]GLZ08165.1 hypothetical protein Acsp03_56310 [Actinomadura sp. NBRC 104412]